MHKKLVDKNSKRIEIERKYLVKNNKWRKGTKGIHFLQGYLSTEPSRTVRVRLEGKTGKLTIKGKKKSIAGDEFEYNIPAKDAEYLLSHLCKQPIIQKKRYRKSFKGLVWEIDVFEGENKGLVIAEVELVNINQKIVKPAWIGKEITKDLRFRNANLVANPYANWKHNLEI